MVRLSRYFLVLVAVAGFAMALPKLYWMAFSKPIYTPYIMYSCIEDDFMIRRNDDGVSWTDAKNNTYTREQFEEKLPLLYVRQLLMSNTMPDSIKGVEMDTHEISISNSTFRSQPSDFDSPKPGLYPLFESQSGRANLEMPADYFRITWRMEFVEAETNKILEEKSRMFSAILYKHGFKFPAKSINGIPTTRKSCDEGYLVIDSEDQLFHVKMIKGEPYVEKVNVPEGLKFKQINCVDFRNKKYYAYLFSTQNEMYILTQDEYELQKWPVKNADPEKYQIRVYGDLFNYNVIISGDDFVHSTVLDAEYQKVDEYEETWPGRDEQKEGKIFQVLFPGQLSLTDADSNYVRFFTQINTSFYWLFFSLVLIGVQFIIVKKRKSAVKNNLVDLIVVGLTGIFGFLAVNIFPNKFFD